MKKQFAFTLIEALVSLAILSILSLITIAGLRQTIHQAEDNAVRVDMLRLIKKARHEADLRQKTVTLCHSSDLNSCGGEWSQGQIIFIDPYQDGIVRDSSQLIAVNKMQATRGKLNVRFYPYYRTNIQFHPLGREESDNGTIWYCHAEAERPSWVIQINQMGVAHELLADENGEYQDKKKSFFRC